MPQNRLILASIKCYIYDTNNSKFHETSLCNWNKSEFSPPTAAESSRSRTLSTSKWLVTLYLLHMEDQIQMTNEVSVIKNNNNKEINKVFDISSTYLIKSPSPCNSHN